LPRAARRTDGQWQAEAQDAVRYAVDRRSHFGWNRGLVGSQSLRQWTARRAKSRREPGRRHRQGSGSRHAGPAGVSRERRAIARRVVRSLSRHSRRAVMDPRAHLFGIRHHGPGSAASLVAALDRLNPAAVLIEGPSDANDLVHFAALPGMLPPVALLVHAADEPKLASFFPFASFSPEWRAMIWALKRERPVYFIDWPAANALAVRNEREAAEPPPDVSEPDKPEPDGCPRPPHDPLDAIAQVSGHSDGEAFWNALVESV